MKIQQRKTKQLKRFCCTTWLLWFVLCIGFLSVNAFAECGRDYTRTKIEYKLETLKKLRKKNDVKYHRALRNYLSRSQLKEVRQADSGTQCVIKKDWHLGSTLPSVSEANYEDIHEDDRKINRVKEYHLRVLIGKKAYHIFPYTCGTEGYYCTTDTKE